MFDLLFRHEPENEVHLMQARPIFAAAICVLAMLAAAADAKVNIAVVHNSPDAATGQFKLRLIPSPTATDAAANAKIEIVDGRRDPNGGDVDKLVDGEVPREPDQPAENFFFAAGTPGGRLVMDLGRALAIDYVNTYSWHPNTRGPQVYKLYGSNGSAEDFNAKPGAGIDPLQTGWTLLAEVDTRPGGDSAEQGGQYGVSVFDSEGPLGPYQYLLFDISRTENDDPFGNTFISEIDVVASQSTTTVEDPDAASRLHVFSIESENGTYEATIDTREAPDLTQWANEVLAPVVKEWYPRIVELLPSENYEAPRTFSITFTPEYRGVAAASGNRVRCSPDWFRRNLDGEAKGAVVHELVHVVQQYGRARRRNPNATRPPGWLVEGVADYIRWFLYEPETRGAEISERNLARARFDASYRISANFLNWVSEQHGRDIVPKLNAALREGRYNEDLWADYTKKTLAELDNQWRASLARALGRPAEEEAAAEDSGSATTDSSSSMRNRLSDEEKQAGWELLFDGKSLDGWHTFQMDGVRPGWQVKDGMVICANPRNAGDLCTNKEYDWFELKLEYNITPGGNSGIMYHVSEDGRTAWSSGPEIQIQDNELGRDPTKSGWLYALYQPPDDPKTGKPLDATKPAGQWNQVTVLITPEKCVHEMNGTKYVEYVLDSSDFKDRVAQSKFGRMRRFARTHKGYIALQGDHGEVSFRNIKIRPIESKSSSESGAGQ